MTLIFKQDQLDWTEINNRVAEYYEAFVERFTAGYSPEFRELLINTSIMGTSFLGETDPSGPEGQEPVFFWSDAISETTNYLQTILVEDYGLDPEAAKLFVVDELGYSTLAQSPCNLEWVQCPRTKRWVQRCCK